MAQTGVSAVVVRGALRVTWTGTLGGALPDALASAFPYRRNALPVCATRARRGETRPHAEFTWEAPRLAGSSGHHGFVAAKDVTKII